MSVYATPESVGISQERLERVYAFLRKAVDDGSLPAAAIGIGRHGVEIEPRAFGNVRFTQGGPDAGPDTIFLVASLTKPVTVAAVMLLVERGMLSLRDRVCDLVPEFGANGKRGVHVIHLMTHTSGLPDMLPEDRELRHRHAPLGEFVERVYALPLDFEPGTRIQYQSMGINILGEIVLRVSGLPLPKFLECELFGPLGMSDTMLGTGGEKADRIAHVNVDEEMRGADWGWNTPYWWGLGAPWGGMFSTVSDLLRFCQSFLPSGRGLGSPLSEATKASMTRDQTTRMPALAVAERREQAWGLGFRLFLGHDWSYFGDVHSPGSFGHGGATGTAMWVDPVRDMACTLFTTEPAIRSVGLLGRCANLVAAAAL